MFHRCLEWIRAWLVVAGKYSLTCYFIRYTLLVSGWTVFAFRTALILRGIDSTRCCKHSSEILSILIWLHHAVAADLSAVHPWCESLVPPHPKRALLDWDLVTVEAIWVKWTHCHVQETSLRWFDLCDMVHYAAGSSIRRWVLCCRKGMDMVSNNTQVDCGV